MKESALELVQGNIAYRWGKGGLQEMAGRDWGGGTLSMPSLTEAPAFADSRSQRCLLMLKTSQDMQFREHRRNGPGPGGRGVKVYSKKRPATFS